MNIEPQIIGDRVFVGERRFRIENNSGSESVKKSAPVPACLDCKNFLEWGSKEDAPMICSRTIKEEVDEIEIDLVVGEKVKITFRTCEGCRKDESDCGRGAKFFIPSANKFYEHRK